MKQTTFEKRTKNWLSDMCTIKKRVDKKEIILNMVSVFVVLIHFHLFVIGVGSILFSMDALFILSSSSVELLVKNTMEHRESLKYIATVAYLGMVFIYLFIMMLHQFTLSTVLGYRNETSCLPMFNPTKETT